MRQILKKFTRSPIIDHFRIQFPLQPAKTQKLVEILNSQISNKSPAIFLSVNGMNENPEVATTLHEAFRAASARKKVPLYSFLEDDINGLSYYVASAAQHITSNPFCKIGDLTAPTKSYTNIHKFLEYIGVRYQNIGQKTGKVWDPKQAPSQTQKQFTKKWLKIIEDKLKTSIAVQRGIQPEAIDALGSNLIHPKKALELRLVNSIGTLQQYKSVHFPNNNLKERSFTRKSRERKFNPQEFMVLTKIQELMAMPKVALMSMEDPISQVLRSFGEIVTLRLQNQEDLDDLNTLAGRIIQKLQDLGISKTVM